MGKRGFAKGREKLTHQKAHWDSILINIERHHSTNFSILGDSGRASGGVSSLFLSFSFCKISPGDWL